MIQLREWHLDDVERMVELFDTEQMNRWTPLPSPFDAAQARAYVERAHAARESGTRQLAVCLGDVVVGEVIVFPGTDADEVELAYAIGAEHQGKGLATRAVLAALDLAREAGARRAVLTIAEGNEASAGAARAAGFALTDAPVEVRRRKGFVLEMRTWERRLAD